MTSELKESESTKVLPQVEARGKIWNPDSLAYEAANTDKLLTDILAKLEEIRVLLAT